MAVRCVHGRSRARLAAGAGTLIITRQYRDTELLAQLMAPEPGSVRSPGLHVSTIIHDVMRTMEPDRFGGPLDPARISLGMAFEEGMARLLRARVGGWEKPGEFRRDGVVGSPDGLDLTDERVDELKATWVSSKDGILHPKLSHFPMQLKGYGHILRLPRARLRVFWVNGDYKPPCPDLWTYELEFTPRELRDNWAMLTAHARKRGWL